MVLEDNYLSPTKQKHFKMIEDYKELINMPYASQKAVFVTIQKKYQNSYSSINSVKQTFARLMKIHPERFNN